MECYRCREESDARRYERIERGVGLLAKQQDVVGRNRAESVETMEKSKNMKIKNRMGIRLAVSPAMDADPEQSRNPSSSPSSSKESGKAPPPPPNPFKAPEHARPPPPINPFKVEKIPPMFFIGFHSEMNGNKYVPIPVQNDNLRICERESLNELPEGGILAYLAHESGSVDGAMKGMNSFRLSCTFYMTIIT